MKLPFADVPYEDRERGHSEREVKELLSSVEDPRPVSARWPTEVWLHLQSQKKPTEKKRKS